MDWRRSSLRYWLPWTHWKRDDCFCPPRRKKESKFSCSYHLVWNKSINNLKPLIIIKLITFFEIISINRNEFSFDFSLTIADIILILDSVLQKSIVQHFLKPPEWYNKTYPHIWHPLKGISLSATIFMVVAVSAERFRAVCHPMSRNHVSSFIT